MIDYLSQIKTNYGVEPRQFIHDCLYKKDYLGYTNSISDVAYFCTNRKYNKLKEICQQLHINLPRRRRENTKYLYLTDYAYIKWGMSLRTFLAVGIATNTIDNLAHNAGVSAFTIQSAIKDLGLNYLRKD